MRGLGQFWMSGVVLTLFAVAVGCSTPPAATATAAKSTRYEDLTTLFHDWRS